MTESTSTASAGPALDAGVTTAGEARPDRAATPGRYRAWIPTWSLIATKHLELRKRRGLMVVVALLILGLPVLVLGIRFSYHAFDPNGSGPAGSPSVFQVLCGPMAEFGFIVAAILGTTAGTTDLTDGMFRHLVITGRSRIALYLARIPAGLSILLPLVAVAFATLCLVTSYAGTPQPTSININGINVPAQLSQTQLKSWILQHPQHYNQTFGSGPVRQTEQPGLVPGTVPVSGAAQVRNVVDREMAIIYDDYFADEVGVLNPPVNQMVKIGLWLELSVGIGFLVGLGVSSLIGQRTVSTVLMIVLEIIVTPLLARTVIPYFINGQRLVVGIAMDQLQPAWMADGGTGGNVLFGGRGALGIPPMPTWAMVTVIVGWIIVWSVIGAWRMATRDA